MQPIQDQSIKSRERAGGVHDLKTMVFTDMVGSTLLKQQLGDAEALQIIYRHHELVRRLLAEYPGGMEIETAGDSFFLVFNTPSEAVGFALRLQAQLRLFSREVGQSIQDRIGIHAGEVFKFLEGDSDELAAVNGMQVDTCARIMSLAGPEHILLTRFAFDNARQMLKGAKIPGIQAVEWRIHGWYELKGVQEPVEICEVGDADRIELAAPVDTEKAVRVSDMAPSVPVELPELTAAQPLVKRLRRATATERRAALIGAGLTILAGWLAFSSSFLDNLSFDLSHGFRLGAGPELYTNDVELVVIDEKSRKNAGVRWIYDWNRTLHAQLVDKLADAQARAVVFDILFETNRPTEDEVFLKAIRRYGKVMIAAQQTTKSQNGMPKDLLEPPFALLRTNAWCGLAEIAPDTREKRQPTLALPPPKVILPELTRTVAEELTRRLGDSPPPLPTGAWMNYYCPFDRIPKHSYSEVLSTVVPSTVFSNKVVFVGAYLENVNDDEMGVGSDRFRTPYSLWGQPPFSGMAISATSYLNWKRGDWLVRLAPMWEVLLIGILGFAGGYVLTFLPPTKAMAWSLSFAAVFSLLCCAQVWWTRMHFAWLIIPLAQVPCAVIWASLAYTRKLAEDRQRLKQALTTRRTKTAPVPPMASVPAPGVADRTARLPFEVPDHQLIKKIGAGAYGQVWLARDIIGTYHAVKILHRAEFKEGRPFEREFHGLQRFTPISRQHPGLVQILHVGRNEQAGFLYYIMEPADDERQGTRIDPEQYLPHTLARDLSRLGALPVKDVLTVGLALAEALEFLHSQGLIHRDIKPANIIFVQARPKLADIGLVTEMAEDGSEVTFLGTPGYTAPEGPGSATADVYSLGKLLYVASTGASVKDFPDLPSSLSRRDDADSLLELNKIILKACEPVAQLRYPTAKTLSEDLKRLQSSLP